MKRKARMIWVRNDGGRAKAGVQNASGDCVARAIAIATGIGYADVCDSLNKEARRERPRLKQTRSSASGGVIKRTYTRYLESLGATWYPTMGIGTGCRVHLMAGELPQGRLVVRLSKHLTAVINGVIHDTYDPQRATLVCENGVLRFAYRCVYGFWDCSPIFQEILDRRVDLYQRPDIITSEQGQRSPQSQADAGAARDLR